MGEGKSAPPVMSMHLSIQTCFFLVFCPQVRQQKNSSIVKLQRLAMIKNIFFFFYLMGTYFYITHKGLT